MLDMPVVGVDWGRKCVRIVNFAHGQAQVLCFVDLQNGDILKPASWNSLAKHARGSVFSERAPMRALLWASTRPFISAKICLTSRALLVY